MAAVLPSTGVVLFALAKKLAEENRKNIPKWNQRTLYPRLQVWLSQPDPNWKQWCSGMMEAPGAECEKLLVEIVKGIQLKLSEPEVSLFNRGHHLGKFVVKQ